MLHRVLPMQVPLAAFFLWRDHASNPLVAKWLPICALGAAVVAVLPALAMLCIPSQQRQQLRRQRPDEVAPAPVRAASSLHGSADWMPERGLQRLAQGGHPDHGGVVYGTACRADLHPDQDGGAAPLLVDRCLEDATHGLIFAGSGGGKTSAFTVPTLDPDVGWRGNVLVNDPSSQVGAMCAGMRRAVGQRVVFLGPGKSGFNVLDWIDPAHPLAEEHVWSMIEAIGREGADQDAKGENSMFKLQGKALQACLLADMLWDPAAPKGAKTLRRLAERVATPERDMRSRLQDIHKESASTLARTLAGTLMEAHPRTFGSFCVDASADLRWLMTGAYAAMVSGEGAGSIGTRDFTHGDVCVFLQLGQDAMKATPQLGRTVLNALLNGVYRAEGRTGRRTLLLLDEIDLFGPMQTLALAASQGRKYGITVVGMWHSLGQMQATWKEQGAETWLNNSSWQAYAAVAGKTAEEVSRRCGKFTALAPSETHSTGSQHGGHHGSHSKGRNTSTSLQPRPLITPDEVERGLRRDEQIVFRRGEPGPIRCVKAYYFLRPGMAARVGTDHYREAAD